MSTTRQEMSPIPTMADEALAEARELPQCEALLDGGRCPHPASRRKWHWRLCRECAERSAYRLEARVLPSGKIETAPAAGGEITVEAASGSCRQPPPRTKPSHSKT